MARQISMAAQFPPISLLPPAADAAGRTSGYRSLRNCLGKAWVVARVNQGNAATVLLTLLQARDLAGSGSKPITAAPIWLSNNTAASDALVAQAAGVNFTTDATLQDKIVMFELTMEQSLDVTNGFNHIAISTGASNAANVTSAELFILATYPQAAAPTSYV